MQLTLIQKQRISRLVLSAKANGQFWITSIDEDDNRKKLITVEGVDGRWVLKSNQKAEIRDSQNQKLKSIVVEPMNFYNLADLQTGETHLLFSEPVTEDRKVFRKMLFHDGATITIGRDEENSLVYGSRFASARHAEIVSVNQKLMITDLNSSNGTFVNGRRVQTEVLQPGDMIYIVGLKMIVGNGFLAVNNPDQLVNANPEVLIPLKPIPASINEKEREEETEPQTEKPAFYRSPRFKRDIKSAVVTLDPPSPLSAPPATPLMLMLGPSMTMGMASLFTGLFSYYNVVSSGGDIKQAIPSLGNTFGHCGWNLRWSFLKKAICPLATSQKQLAIMEYQISTISFSRDLEKRRKQSEYCFKTIRNSVIFIGCFHKLASNANIYMFCDFGRIAPAKMLVEGFPPSPQDRPHSVTAARPADAEKF